MRASLPLYSATTRRWPHRLYEEMKGFFPDNAVDYYVSYYDYYQPEAYMPSTDTYIEKDLAINDEIDKPVAGCRQRPAVGPERRHRRVVGVVHLRYGRAGVDAGERHQY